jgi:hypothetical protein
MAEIDEAVKETLGESRDWGLNHYIAIFVAITATFMALVNIKGGKTVQHMTRSQAQAGDAWNFYQAKSMKQMLTEDTAVQLETHLSVSAGLVDKTRTALELEISKHRESAARYEKEKEEIKQRAEGFEEEYHRYHTRHDQLDLAEAFLTLTMALYGMTALTRQKWLFAVAVVVLVAGIVFGMAGFLDLPIHPESLVRFLA